MNSNEKKEEKPKEENKAPIQGKKLQRKLKFKTLDGNIKHLECDYDIKISELKKKLQEIYNIEPIRQRLLNKGKQFKDDEYLDKLVDKDDTTIHLVFRSEEDVKRAQEASRNNTNTNTNHNNQNVNPFQNILNAVDSEQIRNLTNNIVNQIFGQNNNSNNNNNNNNNSSISINIPSLSGYQTLNVGETLNLNNSPLQPIQNSTNNSQSPPTLNLNNETNQNNNIPDSSNNNNEANNNNLYSGQFPITPSVTDKKYEMHLKNIEKELNEADTIMSKDIQPRIPLPLLNTTQNVFTAMSRSIRKYVIVNQNILCNLLRLADLMEREQYITQSDTRMNGNKLLDQAYKTLAHISKASIDLSNVIKSSNFNTAPNTGYIGIICQEIGYQTQGIPVGVGELNTNSILSALRARNNNNNSQNNNNINMTTINLNNLGNNNTNNNQNQSNISATTLASIPISISVIDSSDPPIINNINNNNNNNVNQETTTNTTNNTNTNIHKENESNKKEKKEVKNNANTNTNSNLNTNNASHNEQNNNNNDINNLLRNTINELMTPENINSIAGAVDSVINNNNTSSNSSGNGFNIGQLLGNILGSIGGENTNNEPQVNQSNIQQTQQTQPTEQKKNNEQNPEKKEPEKKEPEKKEQNKNNNEDTSLSNCSIFKKLVENPQLRKETKVSDEKTIGETMAPNIEFVQFSNDIIANLTIQEIFDMYNLKFSGLARLRKTIQSKYFGDKSKNDEIIKKIVELLCERFILIENQLDKLIPGKEFILEDFFNKELKKILMMFIDDNEVNMSDEKWEKKFRRLIIEMLRELINEIKNIYETGEEGAKTFFEFNIITLIENFIGQKYLNAIQNYDDNVMNNFVENLFNIVNSEEIIKECEEEKKENEHEKKEEDTKDNNIQRPSALSIEEIFKIANKDKDRLEKEDKEKKDDKDDKKDGKKYSDFYYLTSLFK